MPRDVTPCNFLKKCEDDDEDEEEKSNTTSFTLPRCRRDRQQGGDPKSNMIQIIDCPEFSLTASTATPAVTHHRQ